MMVFVGSQLVEGMVEALTLVAVESFVECSGLVEF
jgi:hypothetical protein